MARAGRRPLHTPREWAVRGGLAVAVAALDYISTTQTLAFTVAESSPERGYALNPHDGRIGARFAERISVGEAPPNQRVRADQIARNALMAEPLATPALTALGLNTQLRGNMRAAAAFFAASDRQSRREIGTRLWLIEDAVQRADIPGALRHYDIALRTSKSAPEILFPVLGSAIADQRIAQELVKVLAARPPWSDSFIGYLGAGSPDPRAAAVLFRQLSSRGISVPESANAGAIDGLVTAGDFQQAWALYRASHGQADRRRSRDPEFGMETDRPTLFDWTPITSEAGVTGSIQRDGDRGLFDFAAPATVSGVVLQQMQFLPAGSYRLRGRTQGIDQLDDQRPYWLLTCSDGRELGRVNLANSSVRDGRFMGDLTVPGDCAAQMLRLMIRPSNALSGSTGQVLQAGIMPL